MEIREDLLRTCVRDLPNVSVDHFDGLTIRWAAARGACAMIRGLRSSADFDAEWKLAQINRTIDPDIETVLLMGRPDHAHVSSSAVREMAMFGADWSGYVPADIVDQVAEHLNHTHNRQTEG
jgi:pantetheine-phosphate adenylyltransferase